MLPRHVAIVSQSSAVPFRAVARVSGAIQKQVTRDFSQAWKITATVHAFETLDDVPVDYWPIIVEDNINQPGAAGYHTDDNGQPFSLVSSEGNWALTTSHECLEMLADPFGNRTVAGSQPKQADITIVNLPRVNYLVEVCDPCESDTCSYSVNGIQLSDFITPHYYDPGTVAGTHYDASGKITEPHQVVADGYVSFGNPATNEWYQVLVDAAGNAETKSLGKLNASRGTLREQIDRRTRAHRAQRGVKTMGAAAGAERSAVTAFAEVTKGRADNLRSFIKQLKP